MRSTPSTSSTRFRRRLVAAGVAVAVVGGALSAATGVAQRGKGKRTQRGDPAVAALKKTPTTSSPIAVSSNNQLVWTVNPDGDEVVVIRARDNRVVARIKTGDEPRGLALDPLGQWAFVANAAEGTVTVIRISNPNANRFVAKVARKVGKKGKFTTGSEPWNIVASPDAQRVFVANAGQDTVTVLDARTPRVIGHINIRNSACNADDPNRVFQPRGLAVTGNSRRLFVTRFFAIAGAGGRQGTDTGRQGAVCRIDINTKSTRISRYRPAQSISLAPQITGFVIDANGDTVPDQTSAFPNQLQSIVIHRNSAYLPNIAASPSGPLRFNVDTQAFVNVIDNVATGIPLDASGSKFLNLHLGARQPEAGKKKLFFANAWAIAFAPKRGQGPIYGNGRGDAAYIVSAASDLLVKVNVDRPGKLSFTEDGDTTRYIDLNDPANPATAGDAAAKTPQGIAINRATTRAYVYNWVSRNVSVVDLATDTVVASVRFANLPTPGSQEEIVQVGAEVFFGSRGNFDRPAGTTVSTTDRLASEGWQSCASCHFEGTTDSVVWAFGAGPRKSVPLNATFNPQNPDDQRVLNYSAIFDEVEDFELNIRAVSGPGGLPVAVNGTTNDPAHGLLIGDNGDINLAPPVINGFALSNAGRPQHTVTLPGSGTRVPALTALNAWVRFAIRTPKGPIPKGKITPGVAGNRSIGPRQAVINRGRSLFTSAGCVGCHSGAKWTSSTKDFTSPPAAAEISTETNPPAAAGTNPVGAQYLNRFLRDIGSFNLGVPNGGNPIGADIGAIEKTGGNVAQDALGRDYNGDGKGIGYNVPSLLGIQLLPPYYHNGACETLACVVGNAKHRTANGTRPDGLVSAADQAAVVTFLESIDATTRAP